jgi:putative colanic acid biosynthesis UDP-glucose lipid carrier transferase
MNKKSNRFALIRYVNDALVVFAAYLVALWNTGHLDQWNPAFGLLALVLWYFVSSFSKLYADRRSNKFAEEIIFIIYHLILFTILLSSSLFFLKPTGAYDFRFFVYFIGANFLFAAVTKYILRKNRHAAFYQGRMNDVVLLVGATAAAKNFFETVQKYYYYGYKVEGIIDDEMNNIQGCDYLGKISQLDLILKSRYIDEVVIALPTDEYSTIQRCISICDYYRTKVRILPDFKQYSTSSVSIQTIGQVPVMNVGRLPLDRIENRILKRIFDVTFSLLFFCTFGLILFPLIALLIKLTSKGPVIFKQERWGLNNETLICYKFRTMVQESEDVDEDGNYQQAHKDDPRITRIGAFLRKTNFDEIPQFWNVLMGDMSVVGPRPHPTPLNIESMNTVDNYMLRHIVLPGISGWAQVNGCRGETRTTEDMQERVDFDLSYIHRWSFWLDCQIILQTVINFFRGDQNAY